MRKFKRDLIRAVGERKKVKTSKYVHTIWNKLEISWVGIDKHNRNIARAAKPKKVWSMRVASATMN